MKKIIFSVVVMALLVATSFSVYAEEDQGPVEKFAAQQISQLETGCQAELTTYCKSVTPGGGRGLACIFAHNDKLSAQCESALYNSSQELEIAIAKLQDFTGACRADIEKLCSTVAVGGGRILACLEKNKAQVSEQCNQARVNAGTELVEEQGIA